MRPRLLSQLSTIAMTLVLSELFFSTALIAQSHDHTLYAFTAPAPNCFGPAAPLVADATGNLYGSTTGGGGNSYGCVFELSPSAVGWQESTLYSFNGFTSSDGAYPASALTFDKRGNIYGTTQRGGTYDSGVVFELSPSSGGGWKETVLHDFGGGIDGVDPQSRLVFDTDGNLYGASTGGGNRRGGTVFKLAPGLSGWTETILYSFPASISGPDGDNPVGGVVMDGAGNLYGSTAAGGVNGGGAVFELERLDNGGYKETLIHSFNIIDGYEPTTGLAIDRSGNLYGTTSAGGDTAVCYIVGCGVVFKLTKLADGKWTESVLHSMTITDGAYPVGPVVFDGMGNLYAAAEMGGVGLGFGSVFMLSPTTSGPWKQTLLHRFDFVFPNGADGESPYAGVIFDHGQVFGTTLSGGIYDAGTIFELTAPRE